MSLSCVHNLPECTVAQVPQTFVRSDIDAQLRIALIFKDKFKPLNPINPKPSAIEPAGKCMKYCWDIEVLKGGALKVRTHDGSIQPESNMIIWETMRVEPLVPINNAEAVCVPYAFFVDFLSRYLLKMGIREGEFVSFVEYWSKYFQLNGDAYYILIQPIPDGNVANYLPEMQVERPGQEPYFLKRCYFRFLPLTQPMDGVVNAREYLERLPSIDLGPKSVIDLGGELANRPFSGLKV